MCQLFAVSTSTPLKLSFSWERFALRASEEFGNPDGWGVAYLDDREAQIVREPQPAAQSPYVQFLATHGPPSCLIVSHVRRAVVGARSLANTQPFLRRLGGRVHVFAHNGYVPDSAQRSRSPWLRPTGDTDSEQIFCRLLSHMEPMWRSSHIPSRSARTEVVAEFAAEMRALGAANFLYSDGLTLFAHGHRKTVPGEAVSKDPGLYYLKPGGSDSLLCDGLDSRGDCASAVVVATVPLDDQPWEALNTGEILCMEQGAVV